MESSINYVAFDEIGITFGVIVVAMTFVVLAWNAVKAIQDWRSQARKPTVEKIAKLEKSDEDHERRITNLEQCCEEVRGKLQADWEWQQASVEIDKLMLRSIKQLLKHQIDGNDTNGLKEMEAEIDGYLMEHSR